MDQTSDDDIVEQPPADIADLELGLARRMYSLHYIAYSAAFSLNYQAPPAIADCLKPSNKGQYLLEKAAKTVEKVGRSNAVLALLILLHHRHLLIDPEASDFTGLKEVFDHEIKKSRFRFADRFGRILYDRYNQIMEDVRTEVLEGSDLVRLLDGTEQGVYQVINMLVGPLGLREVGEFRYVPPSRTLPLWHCADPGCRTLHTVDLVFPTSSVRTALSQLTTTAKKVFGPATDWEESLRKKTFPSNIYYDGKEYYDILSFLCSCFSASEINRLFIRALRSSHAREIRNNLDGVSGSPEQIANKTTMRKQVQALLTLSDRELVQLIDGAVRDQDIKVPATELRNTDVLPPKLSLRDPFTEMSMFGLRAHRRDPLVSLATTVWDAYTDLNQLDDLAWRSKRNSNSFLKNAPLDYISQHDPAEVVRTLILPSAPIAKRVGEKLNIDVSRSGSDDDLVSAMLWKFGFNPPRFDNDHAVFRNRLQVFREQVLAMPNVTDNASQELVRGAGVNLFVSVEKFIEELVAYNTWLFSSDHFGETRFVYTPSQALPCVASVLGSEQKSGDYAASWNIGGGNTLGVSLTYLRALVRWLERLTHVDKTALLRPSENLPHFVAYRHRHFPFQHTQFWADCSESELGSYVSKLDSVAVRLEQSKLAEVRNGIDHYRSAHSFPTPESMLACETRLRDALDIADSERLIPKILCLVERNTLRNGRGDFILVDYKGRRISVRRPNILMGLRDIEFDRAMFIPHGSLLGYANAEPIIYLELDSEYNDMWRDYPKPSGLPISGSGPGS